MVSHHKTGPKCPHCKSEFTEYADAKKAGYLLGMRVTKQTPTKKLFCHDCGKYSG